jgi:hypothetical protein
MTHDKTIAAALDGDPKPHTIAPMERELSRTLARIAEPTAMEPTQTLAEARLARERDGVKRRA